MAELEIKLPTILEGEKVRLAKRVEELVMLEAKRKKLLEFIDEVMKGAKQLSDEELVKFGREIKQGRFKKLNEQGLF
jgi:hypothetical protein